jgi:hypothetical protein
MKETKKTGEQEEQRSQVPGVFLETIILDLHDYGQGCVAELVSNLDEVGISVGKTAKRRQ